MQLNNFGRIVFEEWNLTKHIRDNVELDYFVIMPNHFHGILIITHKSEHSWGVSQYAPTDGFKSPSQTLGAIIRGFKGSVTKQINELRGTPSKSVWQRNYYERVIRSEQELYNIRNYILNNPRKWELEKEMPENLQL